MQGGVSCCVLFFVVVLFCSYLWSSKEFTELCGGQSL